MAILVTAYRKSDDVAINLFLHVFFKNLLCPDFLGTGVVRDL